MRSNPFNQEFNNLKLIMQTVKMDYLLKFGGEDVKIHIQEIKSHQEFKSLYEKFKKNLNEDVEKERSYIAKYVGEFEDDAINNVPKEHRRERLLLYYNIKKVNVFNSKILTNMRDENGNKVKIFAFKYKDPTKSKGKSNFEYFGFAILRDIKSITSLQEAFEDEKITEEEKMLKKSWFNSVKGLFASEGKYANDCNKLFVESLFCVDEFKRCIKDIVFYLVTRVAGNFRDYIFMNVPYENARSSLIELPETKSDKNEKSTFGYSRFKDVYAEYGFKYDKDYNLFALNIDEWYSKYDPKRNSTTTM